MNKEAGVGFFLCGIVTSSLALAECPKTMPEQLLQDCIVYEGAGSTFPTKDYAYMDLYNKWLRQQQPTEDNRQAELSAMEGKK